MGFSLNPLTASLDSDFTPGTTIPSLPPISTTVPGGSGAVFGNTDNNDSDNEYDDDATTTAGN